MASLTPELQTCIDTDVAGALREDVGSGDLTALLVPDDQAAEATVIVREHAIVCGQAWFERVFTLLDAGISVDWAVNEGDAVQADDLLCTVRGPARAILTGERAALNFLQTLSATATAANAYSVAVAGTSAVILDTRKTIPGLRLAQKYAVRTGGAQNHRVGLYDGILIKENHIVSAGSIAAAVATAQALKANVIIEVEVETIDEAQQAMSAGADRLLLDNFTTEQLRAAVELRDTSFAGITLEASGGVTLNTVDDIAATGVDFISVGALTKDVRAVDFSMRFRAI
ncbi:MAG: carboxylating nicotinate-nucleotide diphosphorylase [Gammaproteobacteria bacterium]|nr:carboxylating nicotinate-nucleotide diphosphorylase [Gammaproteobacteria bacterium]